MTTHQPRQRGGRQVVPAVVSLIVFLLASGASADMPAELALRWPLTLQQYAQDPVAHRSALLSLARTGTDTLPPLYRLAVADAHLRSGHLRMAARLFDDVLGSAPGEPWAGLASCGRGWTAARAGHLDEARGFFLDATSASGNTGLLGELMVGLLDAGDGAGSDAIARFARIAEHVDASEELRLAAQMGEGYARFWMGDDAGARATFAEVAEHAPKGPVADDARYGAALAQWREGDRAGAAEVLRALAHAEPRRSRVSSALARLDPRSMIRASARQYRRLPLRMPGDHVLALLDVDVPAAARITLRRLAAGESPPTPITGRKSNDTQDSQNVVDGVDLATADQWATGQFKPVGDPPRGWLRILSLSALAMAALWLATRRRTESLP